MQFPEGEVGRIVYHPFSLLNIQKHCIFRLYKRPYVVVSKYLNHVLTHSFE